MAPFIKLPDLYNQSSPSVNLPLILATVWIVRNDFDVRMASTVTIGQYAMTKHTRQLQNDLIDEVLKGTMNPQAVIKCWVESETHSVYDEEKMRQFYYEFIYRERSVWFLDSMEAFMKLEKTLKNPLYRYQRNGLFILVYTGQESKRFFTIRNIFTHLYYLYITNVNVIMMVEEYAYIYTYYPFTPNRCHSPQPEYVMSYEDIESNENVTLPQGGLFPNKVTHMHGCPVSVITWTNKPYTYVKRNPKTGAFIALSGIEGSIITLLARHMNFTIVIKQPERKDAGEIFPNGTATGATRMILEQEANITVMSFMIYSERSKRLQPSRSYLRQFYVLAMPLGRPLTPFERLIKPFNSAVWSCFNISLCLALVCIFYIKILGKSHLMNFVFGQGNRTPFTNLLNTLFGGVMSSRNIPQKNFARYLLAVWMLYTFVLRSAYSGELFNIQQDGTGQNTLQTLREVVANNYTIFTYGVLQNIIRTAIPGGNIQTFDKENTLTNVLKTISEPDSRHKIALTLLDSSINYHNQNNPTRRVHVLKERVITAPLVFYMPRYSFLRGETSRILLRIVESGLVRLYTSLNLFTPISPDRQPETVDLSLSVLVGIFSFYAFLLSICFVVFLLEILSIKYKRIKKVVDFLNS
ncbi:uncharacterized protein [Musca autumnalis]|uniref:uncharacterized protein n=1 Tax=Musca autumnalis TaxID=221902 RepID=UPI003CEFA64F